MDNVTRPCPHTTTFLKRKERAEAVSNRGPSAYQPNALPLGQTGSLAAVHVLLLCIIIIILTRKHTRSEQGRRLCIHCFLAISGRSSVSSVENSVSVAVSYLFSTNE